MIYIFQWIKLFVRTRLLVVNVVYIHDYQVVLIVIICWFHEDDVSQSTNQLCDTDKATLQQRQLFVKKPLRKENKLTINIIINICFSATIALQG